VTAPESNLTTPRAALEPLLSIEAASELLGISQSGIYRLLRGGELPCVKVGGRTLIEPGEIREFIAARRRAASDAPSQASLNAERTA
jgi:excisionase family DNA binding protein